MSATAGAPTTRGRSAMPRRDRWWWFLAKALPWFNPDAYERERETLNRPRAQPGRPRHHGGPPRGDADPRQALTPETLLSLLITAGVVISGPFSIRATWRLWSWWRLDHGRSLLLLAFWLAALIVTVSGIWVGFLLIRRLLGFDPLDWSPPITGITTIVVLQVPMILDGLVQRVAHRKDRPDNIGQGPS